MYSTLSNVDETPWRRWLVVNTSDLLRRPDSMDSCRLTSIIQCRTTGQEWNFPDPKTYPYPIYSTNGILRHGHMSTSYVHRPPISRSGTWCQPRSSVECTYGSLATKENINALQTLGKQMRDAEKEAIHGQFRIYLIDTFLEQSSLSSISQHTAVLLLWRQVDQQSIICDFILWFKTYLQFRISPFSSKCPIRTAAPPTSTARQQTPPTAPQQPVIDIQRPPTQTLMETLSCAPHTRTSGLRPLSKSAAMTGQVSSCSSTPARA